MRTPAGFECRFFFGDYYRGRNREECRLIGNIPPPHHWTRDLCRNCPVPGILLANACPNLVLDAKVERSLLGLIRRVKVISSCAIDQKPVHEPHIGCGRCHTIPDLSVKKPDESDPAA